jgi:hypothetical protein
MEDTSYRQWPFFGNFAADRELFRKYGGSRKPGAAVEPR